MKLHRFGKHEALPEISREIIGTLFRQRIIRVVNEQTGFHSASLRSVRSVGKLSVRGLTRASSSAVGLPPSSTAGSSGSSPGPPAAPAPPCCGRSRPLCPKPQTPSCSLAATACCLYCCRPTTAETALLVLVLQTSHFSGFTTQKNCICFSRAFSLTH